MKYKMLIEKALDARNNAYAPYSSFLVGAALLCADGKIYTGCNIESASYSPTCCAERVAFFKAVSEGKRSFEAIAIVGGESSATDLAFCPPCGVCRQVMSEFCDKYFKIILADGSGEYKIFTLSELLPLNFKL